MFARSECSNRPSHCKFCNIIALPYTIFDHVTHSFSILYLKSKSDTRSSLQMLAASSRLEDVMSCLFCTIWDLLVHGRHQEPLQMKTAPKEEVEAAVAPAETHAQTQTHSSVSEDQPDDVLVHTVAPVSPRKRPRSAFTHPTVLRPPTSKSSMKTIKIFSRLHVESVVSTHPLNASAIVRSPFTTCSMTRQMQILPRKQNTKNVSNSSRIPLLKAGQDQPRSLPNTVTFARFTPTHTISKYN